MDRAIVADGGVKSICPGKLREVERALGGVRTIRMVPNGSRKAVYSSR